MAQRGRKPKPTEIKRLEGNPGKRPLNINQPQPERTTPECPDWLDAEAKNEWNRLVVQMEDMGLLAIYHKADSV